MRAINIIRQILLALAVVCVVGGAIFLAIGTSTTDISTGDFSLIIKTVVLPISIWIFGIILAESKTSGAHKAGIGFHLAAAIFMFVMVIKNLQTVWGKVSTQEEQLFAVSLLIIGGGLVLYIISYVFDAASVFYRHRDDRLHVVVDNAGKMVQHGVGGAEAEDEGSPEEDVHVAALMKWKKLYLEGIITEREFLEQREALLKLREVEKERMAEEEAKSK